MIGSVIDRVHGLFFSFQQHIEENRPSTLAPNSVLYGEASDESTNECKEAAQEAKVFIHIHEDVMDLKFRVDGFQCELV